MLSLNCPNPHVSLCALHIHRQPNKKILMTSFWINAQKCTQQDLQSLRETKRGQRHR
jgi:hypothetical protein